MGGKGKQKYAMVPENGAGTYPPCPCGCGVTPGNYRARFLALYPQGWPAQNQLYKCVGQCARHFTLHQRTPGGKQAAIWIDHVIPQAAIEQHGVPFHKVHCIKNLAPRCWACNIGKSDRLRLKDRVIRAFPRAHAVAEKIHTALKGRRMYNEEEAAAALAMNQRLKASAEAMAAGFQGYQGQNARPGERDWERAAHPNPAAAGPSYPPPPSPVRYGGRGLVRAGSGQPTSPGGPSMLVRPFGPGGRGGAGAGGQRQGPRGAKAAKAKPGLQEQQQAPDGPKELQWEAVNSKMGGLRIR